MLDQVAMVTPVVRLLSLRADARRAGAIGAAVSAFAFLTCLCPTSAASASLVSRAASRVSSAPQTSTPQTPNTQATPSGRGRVVATLSLEGVRVPAVNVVLSDVDKQHRHRQYDERRDRSGDVPRRAAGALCGEGPA